MATVDPVASGTLGQLNIGLTAAVAFLNPLGAQIDGMIAGGIGPFEAQLAAQLNAALSAQAALSIQVSDPLAAIRAALAAIIQLQAALTAALALPPLSLSIGAQVSAAAALSGALTAQLGPLRALIAAALQIKIPAIKAAADLAVSLGAGPAIVLVFDGIADFTTLATIGNEIQVLFNAGVVHGANVINPGDPVSGIIFLTKGPAVFAALQAIIQT